MRISKMLMGLAASTILIAGCASQEVPASQAVTAVELSLAEVRVDAAKFAPEELSAAEAKLAKVKSELAKGNYKDVLAGSSELTREIAVLKEVVVSKQTQYAAATNEWESLSEEVPKMVQAIESRVDTLSGSRKLPSDVNTEVFEAAKAALASMKAQWAEAIAAFNAGHATEAADKARRVQAKAEEVAGQLGISPV
jgi:Skp family chaperone for outer membrane proteins